MLMVPSGTLSGVKGRRISIAEGSTGAGKLPQGSMEVGVGNGVEVAGGGGGGVSVGSIGKKGVAVAVAAGSIVAMVTSFEGMPDINILAMFVHAPAMKRRITNVTITKRRS